MRVRRTLAPTAAPMGLRDLVWSAVEAAAPARSRARLARQIREYLGADGVFTLSSGKGALTALLHAMATLRPGRSVAIPAYTCFSVPAAIVRAGLEPVLVDVDPATLDFDAASLSRVMSRTDLLCIVPTHLFGVAANVERIRAFGRSDVWIVEDAAQGFGIRDADGRLLGTRGDAAIFSLGRGKHLTAGTGGLIATRSAELTRACERQCAALPAAGFLPALRLFVEMAILWAFARPALFWLPAGLPFLGLGETEYSTRYRISGMPATAFGALRRWRTRLDAANAHRRRAVEALSTRITLPPRRTAAALLRFPVLAPDAATRAAVQTEGRRLGLGVSTMYPSAVHRIPEIASKFDGQHFPGADALAERLVTLPTHPYTSPADWAALAARWEAGTSGGGVAPEKALSW